MTDVVQQCRGDESAVRAGFFRRPGSLQRVLGLTDWLADVGGIAMLLEQPDDAVGYALLGSWHVRLRNLGDGTALARRCFLPDAVNEGRHGGQGGNPG